MVKTLCFYRLWGTFRNDCSVQDVRRRHLPLIAFTLQLEVFLRALPMRGNHQTVISVSKDVALAFEGTGHSLLTVLASKLCSRSI